MNKTAVRLLGALAGLICLYLLWNTFFFSGTEIEGLSKVSSDVCTAKIFSSDWEYPDKSEEYILDSEELSQLKTLLEDSSFARTLRSGKPVQIADGTKLYTICFYFDSPEDFLTLFVTGNELLSTPSLAGGAEVRILNRSTWQKTLDGILAE